MPTFDICGADSSTQNRLPRHRRLLYGQISTLIVGGTAEAPHASRLSCPGASRDQLQGRIPNRGGGRHRFGVRIEDRVFDVRLGFLRTPIDRRQPVIVVGRQTAILTRRRRPLRSIACLPPHTAPNPAARHRAPIVNGIAGPVRTGFGVLPGTVTTAEKRTDGGVTDGGNSATAVTAIAATDSDWPALSGAGPCAGKATAPAAIVAGASPAPVVPAWAIFDHAAVACQNAEILNGRPYSRGSSSGSWLSPRRAKRRTANASKCRGPFVAEEVHFDNAPPN